MRYEWSGGAGESGVWRKSIVGVRVGEMSHPQNKKIPSQQRDIMSYIWMSAHCLPYYVIKLRNYA